jgi:lipopolysaccharide/colanic/teichoic acid biosynthesis glycosyltransferase
MVMERVYIAADVMVDNGDNVPNAKFVMRLVDIIFALIGLVFIFPLFFLIALLIKLETRGPVLFVQKRLGLHRKEFNVFKFRTMRVDAEKDGPQWAKEDDPRATRVGRILRKLHLDELPQIWNVLKGDMALVGPRPLRAFFVDELTHLDSRFGYRQLAKPGLTGMAQLYAPRGSTQEDQLAKIPYDLQYFRGFSTRKYIMTIFATVLIVIKRAIGE